MLIFFLSIVLLGALLALFRWQWGVIAAVVIGLLQDPVRKVLPDTPAYLTLATVPIWLAVAAHILMRQRILINRFIAQFPILGKHGLRLAVFLVIPAVLSLTYGRGSWQITLLGGFIYGAGFALILAGWAGWYDTQQVDRFLRFYAICTGIMLLGGVLEYLGWGKHSVLLGTGAFGNVWVTHRTGEAVYMLAGFFRSPDVMGWHAVTVFMVAFIMAMRNRGRSRLLWIALALWGLLNIWMCGRRKMIAMLPVFLGSYLFIILRIRGVRRVLPIVAATLLVVCTGLYLVDRVYPDSPVSRFYMTLFDEVGDQLWRHGGASAVSTLQQAGLMGYGLGMSQQGLHNIKAEKPRLWQESGPSKLVAELGLPGGVLLIVLGYTFMRTGFAVIRLHAQRNSVHVFAGLFSLFIANVGASLVSAQIYGDPFVFLLMSFLAGTLLSGAGMTAPVKDGGHP